MRIQYHYRPRQLAVLAALTLAWLVLLPLAFASTALAAGSDLAARGITTAQYRVLTNPVYYSHPADQRVWRVGR